MMLVLSMMLALAAPAEVDAGAVQDQITSAVLKQLNENPAIGAAVGVARHGKLVYVKTWGLRNVAKDEPIDAQTQFEIGAVTKQFTAAAILQLKEAGKLRLDDSLAKYLPSFPHASELTLRDLLNQVSGLAEYMQGKGARIMSSTTNGSLDKVAELARGNLDFAPDTRWQYSNTNYYVLGRVVELVSGQSYEDYVRQHLFALAGMNHSGFADDESKLSDFATGYWEGDDGTQPVQPAAPIRESWAGGAGSIVSTVADLVAWDNALAGGKIVSSDDYALMSIPGTLKDGSKTSYGMGLGLSMLHGHQVVWHNGRSNGSLTMNATVPDDHIDIIVFENDLSGDPDQMEDAIFGILFPDTVAAARQPAASEDPAIRRRAVHIIDETMQGAIVKSELAPMFERFGSPAIQRQIAHGLAHFVAPTAVIYQGKEDEPKGTRYTYRAEFGEYSALNFIITIDKTTTLIGGIGIQPAP